MKQENNILNKLRQTDKPSVPANFFSRFSNEVLELIELEKDTGSILDQLDLKPIETFKDLSAAHHVSIPPIEKKHQSKKSRSVFMWVGGAIAACFTLFVILPFGQDTSSNLSLQTTNEELLLAYFDVEDLIEFTVESSIDSTGVGQSNDELFYEELENEVYNYLYEIQ